MSNALNLVPQDNNYLTSRLLYDQFQSNSLPLDYTGVTGVTPDTGATKPTVLLDGSTRAYLTGYLTVNTASANQVIGKLPEGITTPFPLVIPVAMLRAGAYIANAVEFVTTGDGVDEVNVATPGNYTNNVTVVKSGPGTGVTFQPYVGALNVAPILAGTGNYKVGNTITLNTTGLVKPIVTVTHVGVVSATIQAGGSGGTNGTQTVTGTTGTGTKFTASVTVAGGAITAVLSITSAGSYTVEPSANDPVTGAGLTGAVLTVVTGVGIVSLTNPGSISNVGSKSYAQFSTSGTGTGATFGVANFFLQSIVSTGTGTGYTQASRLTVYGPGIGGATAYIILTGAIPTTEIRLLNTATNGDAVSLDGVQFFTNTYD